MKISPTFSGEPEVHVKVKLFELPTINELTDVNVKVCSLTATTEHIDWSTKLPLDVCVVITTEFAVETLGGVLILVVEKTITELEFTFVENILLNSIVDPKISQLRVVLKGEPEIEAQLTTPGVLVAKGV